MRYVCAEVRVGSDMRCEILSPKDKTFGIKNKKGKKQQTFIKQVTNQVKYGGRESISKVSMLPN